MKIQGINFLNVPNLRFPEFSDEWELHATTDYFEFKNGLNPEAKRFGLGTKFISVMDILNNRYITYDKVIASVQPKEDDLNEFGVNYGDILFQRSSETLEDVGRANVYLDDRTALFGGFVIRGKKIGNYNPLFFRYLLSSPNARKSIIVKGAGAQHFNISQDGLSKVLLNVPSIYEQEKISQFINYIDERIETQSKIIQQLQSLIKGIRHNIYTNLNCEWFQLNNLVAQGFVSLKRGNVIPKYEYSEEYCYPVYSSSTQKGGLMGYYNAYMFDKPLISWSIDGGGNFFYRNKHKFNVTNVCGYLEADESKFDYRFISELLIYQHSRMVFDYQTKAHPSVIEAMYNLPILDLEKQQCYSKLFEHIYDKLDREISLLKKYEEQKKFLLSNMFI